MNKKKDDYQIVQPSWIKIAAITPYWLYKDYVSLVKNYIFTKNDEKVKSRIINKIKKINNIDFDYSYFVDSGSSAIFFALSSLGINKGDKVVIPSFTCRAVLFALLEAKVKPIFADIDEDYNLDLESLSLVNDLEDIKAIVLPNMYGKINRNYKLIGKLKRKGIMFIEDNATSFGSYYDDEILSDAIIYSFNIGKMINGSGGGVVFIKNEVNLSVFNNFRDSTKTEVLIRFLRDLIIIRYRKKLSYIKKIIKKNDAPQSNLDELYSLKDLKKQETQKYLNCKNISLLNLLLIDSQLKGFCKMRQLYDSLMQSYNFHFKLTNRLNKNELPNYFLLELSHKLNRYELGNYLSNRGVECFWSYFPIHKIKLYKDIEKINDLVITEKKWNNFLYLPFNLFVTESDVKYIYQCCKEFIETHEK
jgi:dTDP-4-amino-4,6-dideoxygalactose transaminase